MLEKPPTPEPSEAIGGQRSLNTCAVSHSPVRPCEWQDGLGSVAGAYDGLSQRPLGTMQRWLEGDQSPRGSNLPTLGMSNSYHGEPYIPADIFNVSLLHNNRMLVRSHTVGVPQSISSPPITSHIQMNAYHQTNVRLWVSSNMKTTRWEKFWTTLLECPPG